MKSPSPSGVVWLVLWVAVVGESWCVGLHGSQPWLPCCAIFACFAGCWRLVERGRFGDSGVSMS
eukprot:scaffold58829_cov30-Tisochrysis_lutea.AAC.1